MKPLWDIAKPQDYPVFRFSDKTICLLDHMQGMVTRKTYRARIDPFPDVKAYADATAVVVTIYRIFSDNNTGL